MNTFFSCFAFCAHFFVWWRATETERKKYYESQNWNPYNMVCIVFIPFLHMHFHWMNHASDSSQPNVFFLKYHTQMSYCMMLCYKVLYLSNEVLLAHVSKRNEFVAKLCTRSLNIHKKRENLFDLISSFPNCIFAIWLRLCIRKYAKRLSFFSPCLFLSISVSSLFRVLLKFTTSFIWTTSCDILLQFLEKLSIYMNACSNFVSVVKHWKALFHAHISSTHH